MLSREDRLKRRQERSALRRQEARDEWASHPANANAAYLQRQAERKAAAAARTSDGVRRSAYEVLLDIANDPSRDDGARIRAAEAAAQYERPKLTASINQNTNITSIGDELDRARQRVTLPKLIDR